MTESVDLKGIQQEIAEFVGKAMSVNPDQIRTTLAEIVVRGTVEKPYYEILWVDPHTGEFNIGYGSYCLENVIRWKQEIFEVYGDMRYEVED